MRRWQAALAIAAGAVVLTLVFAPSLAGGWVFDDHALVEHNVHVHGFADWSRWLTRGFWDVSEELDAQGAQLAYWRPLISASNALDWTVGGGSPGWFHLANLAWQALATALTFLALRRWIGAAGPAIAATVVFAMHPTRVESVAWISGRTDILCTVAILIAAAGAARRLRGARGGLVLEIAGTVAAYACKEQAIVLPIFVAVEAWVARARPPLDRATLRAMAIAALPQLAVAVAYLAVRAIALPIGAGFGDALGPLAHVGVVLESVGRFAALAVAPHELSIQQGLVLRLHGELELSTGYLALGAASLVAMIAIIALCRRRAPGVALGLGVFLLTLAPTANVRYAEMRTLVSERFLYLPLLGAALAVGVLLARAGDAWRRRGYLIAGAVALAFASLSLAHTADFVDEATLWQRELELHPASEAAHFFLVEDAVRHDRFPAALGLLAHFENDAHDHPLRTDLTVGYLVASIGAHVVPDLDRDTLRRFDAFSQTLLVRDQPRAILETPVAHIALDLRRDGYASAIAPRIPNLLMLRAQLASRLGDDAAAIALASQASAACAACITIRGPQLEILAAAGHYDQAAALIAELRGRVDEGQLAVIAREVETARRAHDQHARAQELGALGLWGRAYAADPAVAELAFKAGDQRAAQRLGATATEMVTWAESLGLAP